MNPSSHPSQSSRVTFESDLSKNSRDVLHKKKKASKSNREQKNSLGNYEDTKSYQTFAYHESQLNNSQQHISHHYLSHSNYHPSYSSHHPPSQWTDDEVKWCDVQGRVTSPPLFDGSIAIRKVSDDWSRVCCGF